MSAYAGVRPPEIVRAAAWGGLLVLAVAALFVAIGSTPLIEPDEGRNAEVAREMLERGDFVVPHLNGLPYLDKPVLFFAATAVSIRLFGASEFAARLPAALFTLLTALVLVAWARARFDRETALLSGLVFATCPLVLAFSHIVIFDAVFAFWVTASCVLFDVARERSGRGWCALAWAAAGMATLTKGPVGLLLPLLVECGRGVATGGGVARVFQPAGLLAFALVALPWFAAVTLRHPEFVHYAFVRETLERVATDRMGVSEPFWFLAAPLLGGALPWSLVAVFGPGFAAEAWRARRDRGAARVHLLLWIALPVLFFTLSQSKRPGYVLPVFPALAVWCALVLRESTSARRRAGIAAAAIAASGALVLVVAAEPIAQLTGGVTGFDDAIRS